MLLLYYDGNIMQFCFLLFDNGLEREQWTLHEDNLAYIGIKTT